VGYLSYGNRHADLLFELISRRYEQQSTLGGCPKIVISTDPTLLPRREP
jgi:hypothetical protein